LCKEHEQSIAHLSSGCPNPANNEYIIRHDKVRTHLQYSLYKRSGTETTEDWYSHIPKSVTEHEGWNQGVQTDRQTDRQVLANTPEIIAKNKDRTCLLTDVGIPSDRNVIQEKAKKKLKYKYLKNSANVEHEMFCHTSNYWGHGICK
jgi:hypothetical protein